MIENQSGYEEIRERREELCKVDDMIGNNLIAGQDDEKPMSEEATIDRTNADINVLSNSTSQDKDESYYGLQNDLFYIYN